MERQWLLIVKQRNKSSKHKQQTARHIRQTIIKISNRLDRNLKPLNEYNRKPLQKKEIDTYDDSFDTSASKKDVDLGNTTLVNTACKTDRFVSCHTATVAKTEQNVFVVAEICVQTMITGEPVASMSGKLLITYSGLLFNTEALKSTTSTKEIKFESQT